MLRRISDRARSILLGISAHQPHEPTAMADAYDVDGPLVRAIRKYWGGGLVQPSVSQTRWYPADLEQAERAADNGDLDAVGRLMSFARKDGIFAGVMSTRTGGLVRLPKRFRGDADVVQSLDAGFDSVRSVFDEMFPPQELALLAGDGVSCGVGFGELVPVEGRECPVFIRYEPRFLRYVWSESQWYMRSVGGFIPIIPGDGRWILHVPGGRIAPWQNGLWKALGRAVIRKEHAALHKDNWEAKLANPARVAVSPAGAAEPQKDSFFRSVMAWGVNTVFGMTPGYDVKLIESNGIGWQSFNTTIEQQNTEIIIAIAGQSVTVDGGAGFQNSDIHRTIRADLIKQTADDLAFTLNTQGIPAYVAMLWGDDAILAKRCVVEWDVTPPKDRNSEASSLVTVAAAIDGLATALASQGKQLDIESLCERFAVPVRGDVNFDGATDPNVTAPALAPVLQLVPNASDARDDAEAPTEDTPAQDTALNGAQVSSLLEVIDKVATGALPRESAVEIIKRAFNMDQAAADKLLGDVGRGFTPAAPAAPAAPPPAAPEEVAA